MKLHEKWVFTKEYANFIDVRRKQKIYIFYLFTVFSREKWPHILLSTTIHFYEQLVTSWLLRSQGVSKNEFVIQ